MIVIVTGLPRSGTSMMMQMLEAGGIQPLTDNLRIPDSDNPRGYYEFEGVKKLKTDKVWLDKAEGRSVKVISQLLFDLPVDRQYKVILMRRDLNEVLASQRIMIERRGSRGASLSEEALRKTYEQHLAKVTEWLSNRDAFDVLELIYQEVIKDSNIKCSSYNHYSPPL